MTSATSSVKSKATVVQVHGTARSLKELDARGAGEGALTSPAAPSHKGLERRTKLCCYKNITHIYLRTHILYIYTHIYIYTHTKIHVDICMYINARIFRFSRPWGCHSLYGGKKSKCRCFALANVNAPVARTNSVNLCIFQRHREHGDGNSAGPRVSACRGGVKHAPPSGSSPGPVEDDNMATCAQRRLHTQARPPERSHSFTRP